MTLSDGYFLMVAYDVKLEDNRILPETAPIKHDVPAFRGIEYLAYRAELRALRVHLLSLQESVVENGDRLAIVLEGRDAAGKGRLSAGITHYLNPRHARVIAQGTPTPQAMRTWLGRHYKMMPERGSIVVFDRIRENFRIATLYNVSAVPLAIAGLATPLIAALAMSTSSITVSLNALRLRTAAR